MGMLGNYFSASARQPSIAPLLQRHELDGDALEAGTSRVNETGHATPRVERQSFSDSDEATCIITLDLGGPCLVECIDLTQGQLMGADRIDEAGEQQDVVVAMEYSSQHVLPTSIDSGSDWNAHPVSPPIAGRYACCFVCTAIRLTIRSDPLRWRRAVDSQPSTTYHTPTSTSHAGELPPLTESVSPLSILRPAFSLAKLKLPIANFDKLQQPADAEASHRRVTRSSAASSGWQHDEDNSYALRLQVHGYECNVAPAEHHAVHLLNLQQQMQRQDTCNAEHLITCQQLAALALAGSRSALEATDLLERCYEQLQAMLQASTMSDVDVERISHHLVQNELLACSMLLSKPQCEERALLRLQRMTSIKWNISSSHSQCTPECSTGTAVPPSPHLQSLVAHSFSHSSPLVVDAALRCYQLLDQRSETYPPYHTAELVLAVHRCHRTHAAQLSSNASLTVTQVSTAAAVDVYQRMLEAIQHLEHSALMFVTLQLVTDGAAQIAEWSASELCATDTPTTVVSIPASRTGQFEVHANDKSQTQSQWPATASVTVADIASADGLTRLSDDLQLLTRCLQAAAMDLTPEVVYHILQHQLCNRLLLLKQTADDRSLREVAATMLRQLASVIPSVLCHQLVHGSDGSSTGHQLFIAALHEQLQQQQQRPHMALPTTTSSTSFSRSRGSSLAADPADAPSSAPYQYYTALLGGIADQLSSYGCSDHSAQIVDTISSVHLVNHLLSQLEVELNVATVSTDHWPTIFTVVHSAVVLLMHTAADVQADDSSVTIQPHHAVPLRLPRVAASPPADGSKAASRVVEPILALAAKQLEHSSITDDLCSLLHCLVTLPASVLRDQTSSWCLLCHNLCQWIPGCVKDDAFTLLTILAQRLADAGALNDPQLIRTLLAALSDDGTVPIAACKQARSDVAATIARELLQPTVTMAQLSLQHCCAMLLSGTSFRPQQPHYHQLAMLTAILRHCHQLLQTSSPMASDADAAQAFARQLIIAMPGIAAACQAAGSSTHSKSSHADIVALAIDLMSTAQLILLSAATHRLRHAAGGRLLQLLDAACSEMLTPFWCNAIVAWSHVLPVTVTQRALHHAGWLASSMQHIVFHGPPLRHSALEMLTSALCQLVQHSRSEASRITAVQSLLQCATDHLQATDRCYQQTDKALELRITPAAVTDDSPVTVTLQLAAAGSRTPQCSMCNQVLTLAQWLIARPSARQRWLGLHLVAAMCGVRPLAASQAKPFAEMELLPDLTSAIASDNTQFQPTSQWLQPCDLLRQFADLPTPAVSQLPLGFSSMAAVRQPAVPAPAAAHLHLLHQLSRDSHRTIRQCAAECIQLASGSSTSSQSELSTSMGNAFDTDVTHRSAAAALATASNSVIPAIVNVTGNTTTRETVATFSTVNASLASAVNALLNSSLLIDSLSETAPLADTLKSSPALSSFETDAHTAGELEVDGADELDADLLTDELDLYNQSEQVVVEHAEPAVELPLQHGNPAHTPTDQPLRRSRPQSAASRRPSSAVDAARLPHSPGSQPAMHDPLPQVSTPSAVARERRWAWEEQKSQAEPSAKQLDGSMSTNGHDALFACIAEHPSSSAGVATAARLGSASDSDEDDEWDVEQSLTDDSDSESDEDDAERVASSQMISSHVQLHTKRPPLTLALPLALPRPQPALALQLPGTLPLASPPLLLARAVSTEVPFVVMDAVGGAAEPEGSPAPGRYTSHQRSNS